MYIPLQLHINGQWLQGEGRSTQPVINPASGQVIGDLPTASEADLDAALEGARRQYFVWRGKTALERAAVLKKAAQLVRDRRDHIARVLTLEQGKIFTEAQGEVGFAAEVIDWYAEEGRRAYGRIIPSRVPSAHHMVLKEAVGPVAAFTPWNFPALTPARKIAGALAAGCSIIVKASEETPGTCIELVRCFEDAGLPAGVLNLVFGVPDTISRHLVGSPVIRKISFTGSVPVGKHLAELAARHMKRATMELGGHSPVVICDDVDAVQAARLCATAKFKNAGQICVSPTRFYVQESIHDQFVRAFTEATRALKIGDGLDPASTMGPLANSRRVDAMTSMVENAKACGARLTTSGRGGSEGGNYFDPVVMTDVPDTARVMNEEPFGPVVPIVSFAGLDDCIARANSLPFGLAAYAFTHDMRRAAQLRTQLETGMLGINTFVVSTPESPFGGVKDSGYGHEGGVEGLEAYLSTKFVAEA